MHSRFLPHFSYCREPWWTRHRNGLIANIRGYFPAFITTMADPLSVAAGIGGLLALTLQTVHINKSYIDSVKNAPKIVRTYHRELLMLQSSLTLLRDRLLNRHILDYLDQKHQQTPTILQEVKEGIDGCMVDLQKRLSSIAKKDKTPSVVTRMTWYFNEGEIEKELQRLERYRSMVLDNFNSALSIGHSKHLHDLVITTAEVDQLSQTILQDLHVLDASVHRVQKTSDRTFASAELTQKDVARLKRVSIDDCN